jgi:perosamine synthetase
MARPKERYYQNLWINFDKTDVAEVARAFDGPGFSGKAPVVSQYEKAICEYFGVENTNACSNGTVAIELALIARGIKSGDRVAIPPTAPIMTALPVLNLGAEPVFYDLNGVDFSPSLSDLEEIHNESPIKALITVPMWGYPYDAPAARRFCNERGIAMIEDCAHAFGTRVENKLLGTFGHLGTFSTHERKLLSTGEGGLVITDDRNLSERIRTHQNVGQSYHDPDSIGLLGVHGGTNYRLNPLAAALGFRQVQKLDDKIARRRERVAYIRKQLAQVQCITELPRFNDEDINGYAMVYEHDASAGSLIASTLAGHGIISDTFRYRYKPLYQEPLLKAHARACDNAQELVARIFTVPCHEGLNDEDLQYIVSTIRTVLS